MLGEGEVPTRSRKILAVSAIGSSRGAQPSEGALFAFGWQV